MYLTNRLIDFLVARSAKEHSVIVRTLATLVGASLFIVGMPALVVWCARFFRTAPVVPEQYSYRIAVSFFVIGIPWVSAAVLWQLFRGKGTPVPVIPTRKFLQNGPYHFVRNPMMFGFFCYLLGWAFVANQRGAFAAAGCIIVLLLCEIKFIEQPELTKRFGQAYLDYKKETPFLIPHWRRTTVK